MTVLLTGGAGFIGRHLAHRLVLEGRSVATLDVLLPQVHADPEWARRSFPGPVVVGDVLDPKVWRAALAAAGEPEAVVHLAAETGTGQSMYAAEQYHRVNVDGTARAADVARVHGIPLLVLSSRAVYGEGATECPEHGRRTGTPCCERAVPDPSREGDEHHPVSVYGETKSAAEVAALAVSGAVPVTVVRPQNVVGPGQALHNPYTGVLAAFLAQLREGRPLTLYGDGTATRDVVHVADVADLLGWLLDHPAAAGDPRVLNAGTGTRTTLDELAAAARAAAPVPDPGVVHLEVHRAGDIDHACADLTRLARLGAPLPTRTTAEAVTDFVRASWQHPGAPATAWDEALDELTERGLTS